MVKYYDDIPNFILPWLAKQKAFWVATAPLSQDGLVNLSPKAIDGTFTVVNSRRVWYEDLTGSGVATVAHVRENGRITILFNAFEGPPRLLRLYGRGTIYEFGTPEYDAILPPDKRQISSRAIVVVDVIKVSTSCGWGVPYYEYKGQRTKIMSYFSKKELKDIKAEKDPDFCGVWKGGMKDYWRIYSTTSVDGLPALLTAPDSRATFPMPQVEWKPDSNMVFTGSTMSKLGSLFRQPDLTTILAFLTGVAVSASYFRFVAKASIP